MVTIRRRTLWACASSLFVAMPIAYAGPDAVKLKDFWGKYQLVQSGKVDVVETQLKSCGDRGRVYLDKQNSFDVQLSERDRLVNGEQWVVDTVVSGTLFMHRLEPVGKGRAVLSLQWVNGTLHAVINYVELDSRGRYVCDDHGSFIFRDATP